MTVGEKSWSGAGFIIVRKRLHIRLGAELLLAVTKNFRNKFAFRGGGRVGCCIERNYVKTCANAQNRHPTALFLVKQVSFSGGFTVQATTPERR